MDTLRMVNILLISNERNVYDFIIPLYWYWLYLYQSNEFIGCSDFCCGHNTNTDSHSWLGTFVWEASFGNWIPYSVNVYGLI